MKKVIKKENLILIFILILAAVLRFWQLGRVPPSPDWDEAALGYNAYSIMKTGRDEYGELLPLILRSFDDYKPALYVYLAIPSIKIFGLNTFAVRFPAALLGTLAVLAVYFLARELFSGNCPTSEEGLRFTYLVSLITAFLLAISPWHLQFSRVAFESNVGLFFDILWMFFFLKGLKKSWFLSLAALLAGLNIYLYQAEKIFTPLLVLAAGLIYRKKLFSLPKKPLAVAVVVGMIFVLSFGNLALNTPEIFLRAKGTSFAADLTPFLSRTVVKLARDHETGDFLGLLLDNRRITYALAFIRGYLSHFDLNWLFITGDEARHHAPGMGLLYLWELPFLLFGLYCLVFGRFSRQTKWLIFSWFLLAPIPAAFSSGAPHAVRTLRFLPIPQIFVSLGITNFLGAYKQLTFRKCLKDTIKFLTAGLVFSFFVFNFVYYLNQYFIQLNYFNSRDWQYGYQEAISVVRKIEGQYRKIVVSNQPPLDQSYMFFLFYFGYDPAVYQQGGGTVSGGFTEEGNNFGKYVFRPIVWSDEEKSKEILYVGRPEDFPGDKSVVKTINYLDGQPAMKLVEGR